MGYNLKSLLNAMFPIPNYPYEYYSCNTPFRYQVPFNYMAINQLFYPFYDYNHMERKSPFLSSSEGILAPQGTKLKRSVHVLKKQERVIPSLLLEEQPEFLQRKTQNDEENMNSSKSAKNSVKHRKNAGLAESTSVKPQLSRFVKKNTESNVVNQIFSFLWSREKNHQYLKKILETTQQIEVFYNIMKGIKSKCKSQINRNFLKDLLTVQLWPVVFKKIKAKIRDHEMIQEEKIALTIRKLCHIYIRQISRYSIMTSKKMNQKLWSMHFDKCRQIWAFLFER